MHGILSHWIISFNVKGHMHFIIVWIGILYFYVNNIETINLWLLSWKWFLITLLCNLIKTFHWILSHESGLKVSDCLNGRAGAWVQPEQTVQFWQRVSAVQQWVSVLWEESIFSAVYVMWLTLAVTQTPASEAPDSWSLCPPPGDQERLTSSDVTWHDVMTELLNLNSDGECNR